MCGTQKENQLSLEEILVFAKKVKDWRSTVYGYAGEMGGITVAIESAVFGKKYEVTVWKNHTQIAYYMTKHPLVNQMLDIARSKYHEDEKLRYEKSLMDARKIISND